MIVGNDISKWQGDINFDVYKDHANFLIIKASEGNGYKDDKFSRNQSEARRIGLPLGYYHFARPEKGNTSEAEADWFLKTVGTPQEGEVFALDYEASWDGNVVDWCKGFLDRVQEKIGVRCLIYLNQSLVKNYNWQSVIDGSYGLWIAAYTYDPNKNDFEKGKWPFAAMQQWTSQQQVPGISGNVDGDAFFGTVETFKKYGYHPSTPIDPCEERIKVIQEEKVRLEKELEQTKEDKETLWREKNDMEKAKNGVEEKLKVTEAAKTKETTLRKKAEEAQKKAETEAQSLRLQLQEQDKEWQKELEERIKAEKLGCKNQIADITKEKNIIIDDYIQKLEILKAENVTIKESKAYKIAEFITSFINVLTRKKKEGGEENSSTGKSNNT